MGFVKEGRHDTRRADSSVITSSLDNDDPLQPEKPPQPLGSPKIADSRQPSTRIWRCECVANYGMSAVSQVQRRQASHYRSAWPFVVVTLIPYDLVDVT
jgi:hypothetical protein